MIMDEITGTGIIDFSAGVSRFSGNEAVYRKFLLKFPDDPTFHDLLNAMESQNYEAAFRCAHTLKGNTGNLSLTSLSRAVQLFTEQLRNGCNIPGAISSMDSLQAIYEETVSAIKKL